MIREMKPEDRDLFIEMADDFYHSDAVSHAVPVDHFQKTFEEILKKGPYVRGYILETDGNPVGYLLLSFTYSNEAGGMVAWIEEIYVIKDCRGRGLGKEVFHFLEKEYGKKVKRFRLEVTQENVRAASLYQRMGYEELKYLQMISDRP